MSDKIKWTLLVAGATLLAGFAARKAVSRGWSHLGGGTPPPEDPELDDTGPGKALLWSMALAGAAGGARLLARRAAAGIWERTTSEAPPSEVSL